MTIICQVPSAVVRQAYESLLAPVQEDYDRQMRESKAHGEELEEFGLPALRAKYQEFLKVWESLPKKVQKRTPMPIINEDFRYRYTITYEKKTFFTWCKNVLKWGFDGKDRWYELEYLKLEDIYEFKNPNWGINCGTDNRRHELLDKIHQYSEEFIVELDANELRRLGLDPNMFQKIQRSN